MPCGPQTVRRVLTAATHGQAAAPGIGRQPCLGPGRVEPHDDDRRRLRALLVWLAWATLSLLAAGAIWSAL
jgi:hypothetical protein